MTLFKGARQIMKSKYEEKQLLLTIFNVEYREVLVSSSPQAPLPLRSFRRADVQSGAVPGRNLNRRLR